MTRSEGQNDEVPQSPGDYAKLHQRSFRVAFDFLTSHFPPDPAPKWWNQAAKDVAKASAQAGENKLAVGLLDAVYDYLNDECKRREKEHGTVER